MILVCNWLDLFYPLILEAEPPLAFVSSDGKTFFSMRKLKTYVSESIMYGNDNFSSWLLIPSRPDDFLFFSLDMYLPSSETERYGMTNRSCPLVFCLQKSCRGFEREGAVGGGGHREREGGGQRERGGRKGGTERAREGGTERGREGGTERGRGAEREGVGAERERGAGGPEGGGGR